MQPAEPRGSGVRGRTPPNTLTSMIQKGPAIDAEAAYLLDQITMLGHQHGQQLIRSKAVSRHHHTSIGLYKISREAAISHPSRNKSKRMNVISSFSQQG